jgi:hypothetical protein
MLGLRWLWEGVFPDTEGLFYRICNVSILLQNHGKMEQFVVFLISYIVTG